MTNDCLEMVTLVVTALGVVVLIFYTYFTYMQMKLSREALIAANRALIGPVGLSNSALLAAGPTGLEMMLSNSGRYPAANIKGESGFVFIS
ncbi:MAG TPA: hypothetical protein VHG32_21655, partial [Thermoanaerobaculia bacterium]|nr:hypothetical protein [Thermoanaerobaculia bacterium]